LTLVDPGIFTHSNSHNRHNPQLGARLPSSAQSLGQKSSGQLVTMCAKPHMCYVGYGGFNQEK
jgi:hypothetical protein